MREVAAKRTELNKKGPTEAEPITDTERDWIKQRRLAQIAKVRERLVADNEAKSKPKPEEQERKNNITNELLSQLVEYGKVMRVEMADLKKMKSEHFTQAPVSKNVNELKNSIKRGAGAFSNETRTLVTKEVVGFTAITKCMSHIHY